MSICVDFRFGHVLEKEIYIQILCSKLHAGTPESPENQNFMKTIFETGSEAGNSSQHAVAIIFWVYMTVDTASASNNNFGSVE